MKVLPYLEDIYDMETGQLEEVLNELNQDMLSGNGNCQLPQGVETFEKYERKATKLKECLELELEERSQVDNVINFFTDSSAYFLDETYNPYGGSSSTAAADSGVEKKTNMKSDISQSNLDPQGVMDDQVSMYSSSQKSVPIKEKYTPSRANLQPEQVSVAPIFGANKAKMSKKELQAFMKAKLAQTKVSDSVTTGKSASGPAVKNFQQQKQNFDSDHEQPKKNVKLPSNAPDLYKPSLTKPAWAKKRESTDVRASLMSSASDRNDGITSSAGERTASRGANRPNSRAKKNVCVEVRKTTVTNTSKHIYKPSFGLPQKQKEETLERKKKSETYHLPANMKATPATPVNSNLFGPKQNATNSKQNTSKTAKTGSSAVQKRQTKPPLVKKNNKDLVSVADTESRATEETSMKVESKMTEDELSKKFEEIESTYSDEGLAKELDGSIKQDLPNMRIFQTEEESDKITKQINKDLENNANLLVTAEREKKGPFNKSENTVQAKRPSGRPVASRASPNRAGSKPPLNRGSPRQNSMSPRQQLSPRNQIQHGSQERSPQKRTSSQEKRRINLHSHSNSKLPVVASTHDLIMNRAESLGEFNQNTTQEQQQEINLTNVAVNSQIKKGSSCMQVDQVQSQGLPDSIHNVEDEEDLQQQLDKQLLTKVLETEQEQFDTVQDIPNMENSPKQKTKTPAKIIEKNAEGSEEDDDPNFYSLQLSTQKNETLNAEKALMLESPTKTDMEFGTAEFGTNDDGVIVDKAQLPLNTIDSNEDEPVIEKTKPESTRMQHRLQKAQDEIKFQQQEAEDYQKLTEEKNGKKIENQPILNEDKQDKSTKKVGSGTAKRKAVVTAAEEVKKQPTQKELMKARMEKKLIDSKNMTDEQRQQEKDERLKVFEQQLKEVENRKQKEVEEEISTAQTDQETASKTETEPENTEKVPEETTESKVVKPKRKLPPKPKVNAKENENLKDYSHLYSSFYDIFAGFQSDKLAFDLNYCVRDARNLYATFVNLIDSNAVLMKKVHQFELNPLEKGYKDYYGNALPDHFTNVGKNLNDLELQKKDRDSELMMQAKATAALRDKYQEMKGKDHSEILKQAQELAAAAADAAGVHHDAPPGSESKDKDAKVTDPNKKSELYYRVVKSKSEVYDIITRSFSRKKRWNELPHGLDLRNSWNLLWSWSKIKSDISRLLVWQKANHFQGSKNVSRKDFLKRNIERAQKYSQKAQQVFNIMPLTYILPKEYVAFLETFSELEDKEGKMNYWIMKPACSSRGRGISVVNDIAQICYGEPMVVQRYVKNPLLLNGYKFDLRIYVLVTSVNPLEVFIYKEGFGRFSTQPFTLDPTDKGNKYIHLTNVSINKYNLDNYDCDKPDKIYGGTKVSLQTLKKTFDEELKIDWDTKVWTQIKSVCIKAMVSAQNDIQYHPCCFDLYGFDVIIDEDLKCSLLEINSSPSLACSTLLDDMIKQRLIDDTIDLVNAVDYDRKRLFEVLERRIHEDFSAKQNGALSTGQGAKRTMNKDLTYILNGFVPRGFGEMPENMGNYERLSPSEETDNYLKLIGGQKMFGTTMKISEKVPLDKRDKVRGPGSMPNTQEMKDASAVTSTPGKVVPKRRQQQPTQSGKT